MIGERPFEWSKHEKRYGYLSREDSALWDSIKDSEDEKDVEIKRFLSDKAKSSRASHCASRY